MFQVDKKRLQAYLSHLHGRPVQIHSVRRLGQLNANEDSLKGYGYGDPLRLDYRIGSQKRSVVLETIGQGAFGHESSSDRAQATLWSYGAFNRLPRHVRSLDVGGFTREGRLCSVADLEEYFLLTEYAEGDPYYLDLERLREGGSLRDEDLKRAEALAHYLVAIHGQPGPDPGFYVRRIRELVGHGECIMGILDSYPTDHPCLTRPLLEQIEKECVRWRWKLKAYTHRLSQVHGDFHPWNILFRKGSDFTVLDRARGQWGDPADDVTSITLNYVFFSLQHSGRLEGPLRRLYDCFWSEYLGQGQDEELFEVAPPFLAFRALVMASPVWYPHLDDRVRCSLVRLVKRILAAESFQPNQMAALLGD